MEPDPITEKKRPTQGVTAPTRVGSEVPSGQKEHLHGEMNKILSTHRERKETLETEGRYMHRQVKSDRGVQEARLYSMPHAGRKGQSLVGQPAGLVCHGVVEQVQALHVCLVVHSRLCTGVAGTLFISLSHTRASECMLGMLSGGPFYESPAAPWLLTKIASSNLGQEAKTVLLLLVAGEVI